MMNCLSTLKIGLAKQDKFSPQIKKIKDNLVLSTNWKNQISYVFTKKKGLCLNISLVCTVGEKPYLNVEPKAMWVTTDMIKELLIRSNVEWTIN